MGDRVIALIPVRGGSKSIPLKNIQLFSGKPLVYWSLKAAVECPLIDSVFVSTDHPQIRQVVESFDWQKVTVIDRSPEVSSDTASTESVLWEFGSERTFDYLVLIQATSPLLEARDLVEGLTRLIGSPADSLLSVVRQKRFYWSESPQGAVAINYDPLRRPRRQDWEGQFVENGAFYATTRAAFQASRTRISGKVLLQEMPEETYFELDEPSDWIIAEGLHRARVSKQKSDLPWNQVKLLVCDVDGVLTDGVMLYSEGGVESKGFYTRDGLGLRLVREAGLSLMFLSGEKLSVIGDRALKLGVHYIGLGIQNKLDYLTDFFRDHPEFSWSTTAYIGDDLNDLEALREVGLAACPEDASQEIAREVDYVCTKPGGRGCVREVCDQILLSHVWD